MKLLTELHNINKTNHDVTLQQEYNTLQEQYLELMDYIESATLTESSDLRFADQAVSFEDIDEAMDQLQSMFIAARKGLGFVNKLPPGESKTRHASQVMSNMNRIRNKIGELMRMFGKGIGTEGGKERPAFLRRQAS